MSPSDHDDSSIRRRTTRACDQCRKTKSRCEHHSEEPCRNCVLSEIDCTFLEPSHKRGPPKGYLSALEQRLHDAEALLGVIISSSDTRATTLVADLSKDSLAASIITRIANSGFGPAGRNALQYRETKSNAQRRSIDLRQQQITECEAPMIDGNGHLVFTTPSNTWQDYLNLRLSLESRLRAQGGSGLISGNSPTMPSSQSCPLPTSTTQKLPTLHNAFQFPMSSPDDSRPMSVDTCVFGSPSSISSGKLSISHDSPSEGDSESSLSSIRHSRSAFNVNMSNPNHYQNAPENEHDYSRAPYGLLGSLGLDTGFTHMLDLPFNTNLHQMPDSLVDGEKRIAKSEAETDSWTKLVESESDATSSMFGDGSRDLDSFQGMMVENHLRSTPDLEGQRASTHSPVRAAVLC